MVLPNIRAIIDVAEVTKSVYNGCLQNSYDQVEIDDDYDVNDI